MSDLLKRLYDTGRPCLVWCGSKGIVDEIRTVYGDFFDVRYTSLFSTVIRYLQRRESVLFFCSVPPLRRCRNSVVYFQNRYYALNFPEILGLLRERRYRGFIRVSFFHTINLLFRKNAGIWACQSEDVKTLLSKSLKVDARVLPFYVFQPSVGVERDVDFCYVSFPYPHKNHDMLLNVIEKIGAKRKLSIILTVPEIPANEGILKRIDDINAKMSADTIINPGQVSREESLDIYAKSRYLVFPSVLETLGLPLVEALACGCRIIASDMPYAHSAIENLLCFSPNDENELEKVLIEALDGKYDNIRQNCLVENRVDDLIKLVV